MFCSVPILAESQVHIHGTSTPSSSPVFIFSNSYYLVPLPILRSESLMLHLTFREESQGRSHSWKMQNPYKNSPL